MIKRKKKPCKGPCGEMRFLFSGGKCKSCWAKGRKKSSGSDKSKAKKAAHDATSLLVRTMYADENGMIKCYTCDAIYHIKDKAPSGFPMIQCGHYIKRGIPSVTFDMDNLRPQCNHCNVTLSGNMDVYKERLRKELGDEKFIALLSNLMHLKKHTYTIDELKQLTDERNKKARSLALQIQELRDSPQGSESSAGWRRGSPEDPT